MASPTSWGISLFDEDLSLNPIQGPFNLQANSVNNVFDEFAKKVDTDDDLPDTGNWPGRMIWVTSEKAHYKWDGTDWKKLGGVDVTDAFEYGQYYGAHGAYEAPILHVDGTRCHLFGTLTNASGQLQFSGNTDYVAGTFPDQYAPSKIIFCAGAASPITSNGAAWITVHTDGKLHFALEKGSTYPQNQWLLGIDAWWTI